jgi:hypothetical protein
MIRLWAPQVEGSRETGLAAVEAIIAWQSGHSSRSRKTVRYRAKGRSHCKEETRGERED